MKCYSRSTLGVVIGILNVLVYTAGVILSIVVFIQLSLEEYNGELPMFCLITLVVCLILLVISGLLIMGIVKRRHKLMLPWLILSGIAFVIGSFESAYNCFVMFSLARLIVVLIAMGLSGLITWYIYTLYRDIRNKNMLQPGQVLNDSQIE